MTTAFNEALDRDYEAALREQQQQNLEHPGRFDKTNDKGAEIVLISDPSFHDAMWSDEDLMREHGVDPEEWEVYNRIINRHTQAAKLDGRIVDSVLKQHKIWLRPRPARLLRDIPPIKPWTPPAPRPLGMIDDWPRLYMVTSDLQIPYFDEPLHQLTCQMAHDLKIDKWFDGGDEFDLPTLSRWQKRRSRFPGDMAFDADLVTTRDIGRQVFSDRAQAVSDYCELHICDSNHLERWDTYIMQNCPELAGVIPHIRELAGLPELGWQIHLSDYGTGTYQMAEIVVAKNLILIHGNTAKGATQGGQSVMAELIARVNTSVMQGHCNHLAAVSLVRGGVGDENHIQRGFEVGMMGQLRMPFGTRKVKDWQQGLTMVTEWPDGEWNVELVPYYGKREIIYRDQRWHV